MLFVERSEGAERNWKEEMGRLLIGAGVVLVLIGLAVQLGLPIGRLPGDIRIQRGTSTFYFPIVTCIVVSIVLTVLSALFRR